MSAVERQQGHQVEDPDEHVDQGEDQEEVAGVVAEDVGADLGDADDRDGTVGVVLDLLP
jgi:hypothetical protein